MRRAPRQAQQKGLVSVLPDVAGLVTSPREDAGDAVPSCGQEHVVGDHARRAAVAPRHQQRTAWGVQGKPADRVGEEPSLRYQVNVLVFRIDDPHALDTAPGYVVNLNITTCVTARARLAP